MSWLTQLSANANKALASTVASIDKALDIKEKPKNAFDEGKDRIHVLHTTITNAYQHQRRTS
jgi:ElaB/YqjD/DUF883 family membrane-anchored ribosome-binding protein